MNDNLKAHIREWLTYLSHQKGYSLHTIRAYRNDLKQFFSFFYGTSDILSLETISVRDLRAWLMFRQQQNIKPVSNARAISAIRVFFDYMTKYHGKKNDAINILKTKKGVAILPRALTEAEVREAISKINRLNNDTEEWINARDYAILMLLYGCGMRISEVLSITTNALKQSVDFITICGKGKKERTVPILSQVKDAVLRYIEFCPFHLAINDPIFRGKQGKQLNPDVFRTKIRLLRTASGLPFFTSPHSFRHCFATHLLDHGVDIRILQELLGHSSLSSTERYTKISHTRLASEYFKYHPRASKK